MDLSCVRTASSWVSAFERGDTKDAELCSQCSPFLLGVWLMFDDTSSLMCSQNPKRGYVYWGLCTLRLVREDIVIDRFLCSVVGVSLVAQAQMVENLPAMQETRVRSLGWEDALEEKMALHLQVCF